jgi:hypothetical protein
MGAAWTKEEKRILKRIWKSPKSLECHIHQLPGRSVDCARTYGRKMGLPLKPRAHTATRERIIEFMNDGIARTALEIARVLKLDRRTVRELLMSFVAVDKMHLTGECGPYRAAYYRSGPTPPGKPKLIRSRATPKSEALRRALEGANSEKEIDRLLDEAYRSQAGWWPRADRLILDAMSSMVRSGREAV